MSNMNRHEEYKKNHLSSAVSISQGWESPCLEQPAAEYPPKGRSAPKNGPGTSNGSARDQNSVANVNGGIVAGIAEAKHYFNVVKFVFLAEFEGLTESFCFQCGL
jgi:hypothetical protein